MRAIQTLLAVLCFVTTTRGEGEARGSEAEPFNPDAKVFKEAAEETGGTMNLTPELGEEVGEPSVEAAPGEVAAEYPMSGPCTAENYNLGTTGTAIACQNCLNMPVDGTSHVTAAHFVTGPPYNNKCKTCLKVSSEGAPDVYMRVIDLKGAPGLDLNEEYIYSVWPMLQEKGSVECSWEFVEDSMCTWPAAE